MASQPDKRKLLSKEVTAECSTCDRGLCDLVRHDRLLHDGQRASPVMPHRCYQGRRAPARGPACFLRAQGAHRPCAAQGPASRQPGESQVAPSGPLMCLGVPTTAVEVMNVRCQMWCCMQNVRLCCSNRSMQDYRRQAEN